MRSRWTQIFAVVFGVLVASPWRARATSSPAATACRTSRAPPSRSCSSCCCSCRSRRSLIGVLALAPERGAAELLFSQPVSRRTILLGKLLGLFLALAAAQAVGFGARALVVYAQSGLGGPRRLPARWWAPRSSPRPSSSASRRCSPRAAVGRKRTRALALALVVWFVAVVLFDVAALGARLAAAARARPRAC